MQPDQLALNLQLDSPLMGKAKNDRNLMVYAWFGLNREKQTELPVYDDGKVRIEVTGTRHGAANIWDAELLIYLASIIQERINLGMTPEPLVSFAAHDFFRITETKPGGSSYDRLEEGLARLRGTLIRTNIERGGEGETEGFGWIDSYKIQYRRGREGEKIMPTAASGIKCSFTCKMAEAQNRTEDFTWLNTRLSPCSRSAASSIPSCRNCEAPAS